MISRDVWENLLYAASLRPLADQKDVIAYKIDYWKRMAAYALPCVKKKSTTRAPRKEERTP